MGGGISLEFVIIKKIGKSDLVIMKIKRYLVHFINGSRVSLFLIPFYIVIEI